MEDINVKYADMPTTIRAYTVFNKDLTYTVIINAKLTRDLQLRSYCHELRHIRNGDYEKKNDIGLLELYAHASGSEP